MYANRWIGRGAPVAWPPPSPCLTPLDFFLWGRVEELVCATPVESEEDREARIVAAGGGFDGKSPSTMDFKMLKVY